MGDEGQRTGPGGVAVAGVAAAVLLFLIAPVIIILIVSFSGADIAAHCGYTDQAHLIRECRELTGTTPSRLTTTETTLATLMREDG